MRTTDQIDATDPEREYRAIEATLLATSRGRWFLAEHGRRAMRIDGALLEDAIQRLKTSLREPTALIDQLERELTLVRGELDSARAALTARPAVPAAGAGPDSSVQRILSAAQQMHELAWTLQGREGQDFDQSTCEQIARQAVAVYALSREQATATEHTLALLDRLSAAGARLDGLLRSLDLERKSGTEG